MNLNKIFYHPLYRIAQNFDVSDVFQLDRQILTRQIFWKHYSVYRCMVKDSDHLSKYFPSNIWKVVIRQNFVLYGTSYQHVHYTSKVILDVWCMYPSMICVVRSIPGPKQGSKVTSDRWTLSGHYSACPAKHIFV